MLLIVGSILFGCTRNVAVDMLICCTFVGVCLIIL